MPAATAPTLAILSPGAMGAVVARVLVDGGLTVLTCLEGRSDATAARSRAAGVEEVDSYEELVRRADLVLSILVPAEVLDAAGRTAFALEKTGASLVFVDCNAVSPDTARDVAGIIEAAGARAVDAGIIGPPPTRPGVTRFYASGAHAGQFAALTEYGLDVRVLGDRIGQASAFKMCYAAQTKGRYAIFIQSLVTAARLGLYDALVAELKVSQAATWADIERSLPDIPRKADRWVGEMEEIAATFDGARLAPQIFDGVADLYRRVGDATFGSGVAAAAAGDEVRLRALVDRLAARLDR